MPANQRPGISGLLFNEDALSLTQIALPLFSKRL